VTLVRSPPAIQMSVAERLGLALQVIFRRGCYLDYPLASIRAWLLPPAQLHQLHIFKSDDDKLLGYMTWAWFGQETESRWKQGRVEELHVSEWNEGDHLWILDFVAMPGQGRLCASLAPSLFPSGTVAHSLPRRSTTPAGTIIRWTRRDSPDPLARRQRIR
jgi:cytolysin-activating lysine-acyltransferase